MRFVRLLPLTVVALLTVAAALTGLRNAPAGPSDDEAGRIPPPGLSDNVVSVAAAFGYEVEPLAEATKAHAEDARVLAAQHGATSMWPDQVVLGVGLAHVRGSGLPDAPGNQLRLPQERSEDRNLYWVIVVDGVESKCLGIDCDPGGPYAARVVIADPVTLEAQRITEGGVEDCRGLDIVQCRTS